MRVIALLLILCLSVVSVSAQSTLVKKKISIGVEQDVLPYVTGGYYAAAWCGKNHVRGRVLMANVHKPGFITPDGFINNRVTAYALLFDYFLKTGWKGWWAGAGLVYWDSNIQHTTAGNTAYYRNTLLNGSVGFQWKFYKNFYLCPWAGIHVRVGGARHVTVDGRSFSTPVLNPEASLKAGWYF
jgi:hypothetical protein